jgi:hypothetical protein
MASKYTLINLIYPFDAPISEMGSSALARRTEVLVNEHVSGFLFFLGFISNWTVMNLQYGLHVTVL